MKEDKKYYKPEYANNSNEQLQKDITINFDEIQYIMRKMLDVTLLSRQQLEELHTVVRTLHFTATDMQNL